MATKKSTGSRPASSRKKATRKRTPKKSASGKPRLSAKAKALRTSVGAKRFDAVVASAGPLLAQRLEPNAIASKLVRTEAASGLDEAAIAIIVQSA